MRPGDGMYPVVVVNFVLVLFSFSSQYKSGFQRGLYYSIYMWSVIFLPSKTWGAYRIIVFVCNADSHIACALPDIACALPISFRTST